MLKDEIEKNINFKKGQKKGNQKKEK